MRNSQRVNVRTKSQKVCTSSFVVRKTQKINESLKLPISEKTVLVRGNRPWEVCLLTVLWSQESTNSCYCSRLSESSQWDHSFSMPGLHVTCYDTTLLWHVFLWCCSSLNLSSVLISQSLTDTCVLINQWSILSGMHTGPWEGAQILMGCRLCCCEAECDEWKAVFICAASLRITFSKPHPVLLTHTQVSWSSHKMKSTRVCPDYWIKAPNWNTKSNTGNLQ